MKISKLDGARRQLHTAIRLYFLSGDALSTHTLAGASLRVLADLREKDDALPNTLMSYVHDLLKPEHKSEFFTKLNKTANFLKHAQHDPASDLDYDPEQTEAILFIAVHDYQSLSGELSPHIALFRMWYAVKHPKYFNTPTEVVGQSASLFGDNKLAFYQECLPLVDAMQGGIPSNQ